MPEGHSLFRAARLWNTMKNEQLSITSPQGRFSTEAQAIDGMELLKAEPYGKHLFLHFATDKIVHIHLALYGKHYVFRGTPPVPKETVRLRVRNSHKTIDLIGPAVCELLTHEGYEKVLKRLGPDPLKLEEAPEDFLDRMAKSSKPVGQVLMEQTLIVGIGNVYRAEVLFFRALNPWKPSKDISRAEWKSIWKTARELLQSGAELRGPTHTLLPQLSLPKTMSEKPPKASSSRFSYAYKATGKPCLACGNPIKAEEFHGRMLYWCPTCQV